MSVNGSSVTNPHSVDHLKNDWSTMSVLEVNETSTRSAPRSAPRSALDCLVACLVNIRHNANVRELNEQEGGSTPYLGIVSNGTFRDALIDIRNETTLEDVLVLVDEALTDVSVRPNGVTSVGHAQRVVAGIAAALVK